MSFDERFESVRTASLLILDDLGSHVTSPWAQEKLFQILNYRYNLELPTVITTNYLALEDFEPRIRSRLSDDNFVRRRPILAGDFRQSGEAGHQSAQDNLNSISQVADMTFDNFSGRKSELPAQEAENLRNALALAQMFAEEPDGWPPPPSARLHGRSWHGQDASGGGHRQRPPDAGTAGHFRDSAGPARLSAGRLQSQ